MLSNRKSRVMKSPRLRGGSVGRDFAVSPDSGRQQGPHAQKAPTETKMNNSSGKADPKGRGAESQYHYPGFRLKFYNFGRSVWNARRSPSFFGLPVFTPCRSGCICPDHTVSPEVVPVALIVGVLLVSTRQ